MPGTSIKSLPDELQVEIIRHLSRARSVIVGIARNALNQRTSCPFMLLKTLSDTHRAHFVFDFPAA
jgi:hypothetical protein